MSYGNYGNNDGNQNERSNYENRGGGGSAGGNYSNGRPAGGYSRSGSGNNYNGGNRPRGQYRQERSQEDIEGDTRLYQAYVIAANKEYPEHVRAKIVEIATKLEVYGFTARIDGSEGISDVISSALKRKEIYIPWKNFRDINSKNYYNTPHAFNIAKMFHSAFDNMKSAVQAFLARNARLVLGKDLKSPSRFMIVWTEDGAENPRQKSKQTGFLSHVIDIAGSMHIPTFNFQNPDAEERLMRFLNLPEYPPEPVVAVVQRPGQNNQDQGGYQQRNQGQYGQQNQYQPPQVNHDQLGDF